MSPCRNLRAPGAPSQLQPYPRLSAARPTLDRDITFDSSPRSALAAQRGDELGGRPAAIEQASDMRAGPAQRLESGYPLQGLMGGDVDNHRVPGGCGDGLGVLPQAPAAEIGPGVLGRILDGADHILLRDQPDHAAPRSQPVVQAARRADV